MKLLFNHDREPFLPSISIWLKLTPKRETCCVFLVPYFFSNMKSSNYIESIARSADRKVGSLCPARQFFLAEFILHIYKSSICLCFEKYCHIWSVILTLNLKIPIKSLKGSVMLLVLTGNFDFSHILTAVMWLSTVIPINIFMAVVLISSPVLGISTV